MVVVFYIADVKDAVQSFPALGVVLRGVNTRCVTIQIYSFL